MPPFELDSLALAQVMEEGSGYAAGLRPGDKLLAINGETITGVQQFIDIIAANPGSEVELLLERDDESLLMTAVPALALKDGAQVGQLGVRLATTGRYPEGLIRQIDYTPLTAIPRALNETYDVSAFVLTSMGKLVMGELSPKNLSGPITIAKVAGDSARSGIDNFIRFMAILSIMLGVMNLLPVPVLDGGHLMYYLIEVVKGSPVSDRIQIVGYKVGFVMLMGLMIFATYNDVTRVFLAGF